MSAKVYRRRLAPSEVEAQERRERRKAEALALWRKPGRTTQEEIAQKLGVSQAHVGVLLREAGVCVGRGRNFGAIIRRGVPGQRGFVGAHPCAVRAAANELAAMPVRVWGALKVVALEHGVPDSSVHSKLRQMQRAEGAA
jgi:hypothetical protein